MNKVKDITKNPLFIGSMFIGLGVGFIFDSIPAGLFLGLGFGYIITHLYKSGNN